MKSWSRQQYEAELAAGKSRRRAARNPEHFFEGIYLGPEGIIQKAFVDWMETNGQKYPDLRSVYAIGNESHGLLDGKKRKFIGRKAGMPDIHLPVRSDKYHYYGLWIEFKAEGMYPDKVQKQKHQELRELNHRVEVCRSWTDAANIVIDYLDLPITKL